MTPTLPKLNVVGVSVTGFVVTPAPLNATVCGLLVALVLIVSVALCDPVAVGLKAKTYWQLACEARVPLVLVGQVVAGAIANAVPVWVRVAEWIVSVPAR